MHVDYTFQVKVIIWRELIFEGNSYKKFKSFYTKARAVSVYGTAFPQTSTTSVRIEDQILPATSKYPFFCSVANSNINQVHVLSHNKILKTLLEGKKPKWGMFCAPLGSYKQLSAKRIGDKQSSL